MFRKFNPNKNGARVGDCTVRALCMAMGQTWERVYIGICLEGLIAGDMPDANAVWGAYLHRNGFVRRIIPDECPDGYTVADFCKDHPAGCFVLAIGEHVVTVKDGDWYDTWDSGGEIPIYYWTRDEQKEG